MQIAANIGLIAARDVQLSTARAKPEIPISSVEVFLTTARHNHTEIKSSKPA